MSSARWLTLTLFGIAICGLSRAQDKEFPKAAPPRVVEKVGEKPTEPKADPAPGDTKTSNAKTADTKTSEPKPRPAGERMIKVQLMDGSVVNGKLSVNSIMVETEFGKLEVPVTRIVSFTPGMNSHPAERDAVRTLVLQLGANEKTLRDDAEKQLASRGASVKKLLEQFREDKDTERRNRVVKLLEDLEQQQDDDDASKQISLIDEDTIQTPTFTMVGTISPRSFQVQTKFGALTVNLSDVRRVEHEADEKPDIRKTFDVQGNNLAMRSPANSGIKVNRGDKIEVEASGSVIMSPWGSESISGPEGSPNYGQMQANIYGGALVVRYGTNGGWELVGRSKKFTATKAGVLYFAVAMQPNYAGSGYQFPGSYKVKLKVNPQ